MIFSKLWQRHLLCETVKFILFFLSCIYLVYIIIDFSTHSTRLFSYSKIQFFKLFLYYLHHFILRLPLFLPLALLLATIKILCGLNIHNELVALKMGGISFKELTVPFFFIATMISLFSYMNYEFLSPYSFSYVEKFKEAHLRKTSKKKQQELYVSLLKDGSKLVYQSYNPQNNELFDVFWIHSPDDIWYMKYLRLENDKTKGFLTDHFLIQNNMMVKKQSYEEKDFPKIRIKTIKNRLSSSLFESHSLSLLFRNYCKKNFSSPHEKACLLSHLNFKLAIPLLPYLILLALTPFCLRFSRNLKVFYIIVYSLFAFSFFYTLMEAAIILGENQVIYPFYAIWTPFLLSFIFFAPIFYKTH